MALTTIIDIKTFLQITTTASDALIEMYREIVESEIEAYVSANLIEDDYIEVLNYERSNLDLSDYIPLNTQPNTRNLYLKNQFVTTFTLVNDTTTVSNTEYRLFNNSGFLELYSYQDDFKTNLKAYYKAGFTTATAPIDLKSVVYQGVRAYYQNNQAAKEGFGNIKSESVKNYSYTKGNNQDSLYFSNNIGSGMTKTYLAANNHILDKYRRVNL